MNNKKSSSTSKKFAKDFSKKIHEMLTDKVSSNMIMNDEWDRFEYNDPDNPIVMFIYHVDECTFTVISSPAYEGYADIALIDFVDLTMAVSVFKFVYQSFKIQRDHIRKLIVF